MLFIQVSLTLGCPMDLALFPLDTQTCHLTIASYGWAANDLVYLWKVEQIIIIMIIDNVIMIIIMIIIMFSAPQPGPAGSQPLLAGRV